MREETGMTTDGRVPRDASHAAKLAALDPEKVGTVAMGARREYAEKVRSLVAVQGDVVRESLASDETVKSYCEALKEGVRLRSRTELNLYAQIMKLVGEERRIIVEFVQGLGVKSEADLQRLVGMAKSVEGVGPHDGAERCVTYLEAYFNAYPDQRPVALKRLGGYVPV